jgi:subfamily B ATP-binding cassette protein MsbA
MTEQARDEHWLPHFRRSLKYLVAHRRVLIIGLITAIGVSVTYTFSISTIIPILKVIFADHETLVDWLHRAEAERRLGIGIAADVPDDPAGLRVNQVKPTSHAAGVLREGDRIAALDGTPLSSYAVMKALAERRDERITARVIAADGATREVTLSLRAYRGWWNGLESLAGRLPATRDARSRLLALAMVMAALVLVALVGGICHFVNDGLVKTAVQRAMHDLRSQLGDHVLRLPVHWHSTQPLGDTLARLATDISKVEVGQATLFGKVVTEPLKAVGVLLLTLMIDWHLLVVALIGLPIGAFVMHSFGRLVKRSQRRASQSWGRLLDHLSERLWGIRIVKAYNMQEGESRRFEQEGRTLTRAQTHIEMVDAATNPALEVLAMVAVAAFVLYGGNRVFQQQLEPHLFFAAVVCLGGIFDPVRKMGNVNNRLQAADASARRLFELLDLQPEEASVAADVPVGRSAIAPALRAGRPLLPPFQRTIEFRDVCFSYPGTSRIVLEGINLRVDKGEMVALVGPNGSGKTTLVSLLLRFYEPTNGRILLDGQDIAQADLASLRAQIGLVTQEAIVFSGTLRENIAYGADGVADETILAAARLAHVEEVARDLAVAAPGADPPGANDGRVTRGYGALISSRTLSGGERQRIALARAILRDPPILILDEATSQVDSESEQKIQQAMEDVTRNRTTFVIAHRFSTIAHADRIVVLNEGRIVGRGRHDDLLKSCPFYVSLCETQFAPGT